MYKRIYSKWARVLAAGLCVCLISVFAPMTGARADGETVLDISKGSIRLYENAIKGVQQDGTAVESINPKGYIVIGSSGANSIAVYSGEHQITLKNVRITSGLGAFMIDTSASVQLTIEGSNLLQSGEGYAGLAVVDGAVLNISGTGSLTAKGGAYGAGIGGSANSIDGDEFTNSFRCGTVVITDGTIDATGGDCGAGIGGGRHWEGFGGGGGSISISGGKVTATGGAYSAGIGGACNECSVTVSGGVVNAIGGKFSDRSYYDYEGCGGAGIGGGSLNGVSIQPKVTVEITGGKVTASGGEYAAGIGTGFNAFADSIKIVAGEVKATGGVYGAGIGCGSRSYAGLIAIYGGDISAVGGKQSAGVGYGGGGELNGYGGTIYIAGGAVDAVGGEYGAGVGGGNCCGQPYRIIITDGEIKARGGVDGAGIGCGGNEDVVDPFQSCCEIFVLGGTVTATGGSGGAGIGAGRGRSYADIVLADCVVNVKAGDGASGVGDGKEPLETPRGTIAVFDNVSVTGWERPNE